MAERRQDELVEHARATLPTHVFHYISVGAREGVSLAESLHAWQEVRFRPMVLRGVRSPQLSTTLLGRPVEAPIGIAPTSLQRLAHRDGELAMAQAAAAAGTLLVISSNAGTTFEEIGAVGATWWLQAYATADRSLIASTFVRAAEAGASALVLTVDTPMPGTLSTTWTTARSVISPRPTGSTIRRPSAARPRAPSTRWTCGRRTSRGCPT